MSGNLKPRNLDQPLILSAHPAGVGAIDVENPARPLPVLVGPLNLKPGDHIDLSTCTGAMPMPPSATTNIPRTNRRSMIS